jgi:plastocyanin
VRSPILARLTVATGAIALLAGLVGCGSSDDEATKLSLSITEQGKTASFKVPKSTDGGLVEVTFRNQGKSPHEAQFARLTGGHDVNDLLKTLGSDEIPPWVHAEGGPGKTEGGATSTTTVDLPAGDYVVLDTLSQGKPPTAAFKVASGESGDLPSTDAEITAAEDGKEEYKWEVSGLKAGRNEVTFVSEGKKTLHHAILAPIKGDATIADVKKSLQSQSGPPPIDSDAAQQTTVLDGDGKSEVTTLNLKPGRYALVCFFNDRDENKPHFLEGLLDEVEIK